MPKRERLCPQHEPSQETLCPQNLDRRRLLGSGLGALAFLSLGGGLNVGCLASKSNSSDSAQGLAASGRPQSSAGDDARTAIFWVEAGVCTGCACSLLDSVDPTVESLLPDLRLEFQATLMDRSGPVAFDRLLELKAELAGTYVLVVDGAIASSPNEKMTIVGRTSAGKDYSAAELISELGQSAKAALALGTCAAFGGIPAARPNPSNAKPLSEFVPQGTPLVRVPGCPPHPDWIVDALTQVLRDPSALSLDDLGRPLPTFGQKVHDLCPRRSAYDSGQFADHPGDPSLCLYSVGCRGPQAPADCPQRKWNGQSFCIGANHPCIACTSPTFPDEPDSAGGAGNVAPFYYDS